MQNLFSTLVFVYLTMVRNMLARYIYYSYVYVLVAIGWSASHKYFRRRHTSDHYVYYASMHLGHCCWIDMSAWSVITRACAHYYRATTSESFKL